MKSGIVTFMAFFISLTVHAEAIISGKVGFLKEGDTVYATMNPYGHIRGDSHYTQQKIYCSIRNHTFRFEIPSFNHPICISINFERYGQNRNLNSYVIERGDSVWIDIDNDIKKAQFSGTGAGKFRLIQSLKLLSDEYMGYLTHDNPDSIVSNFEKYDNAYLNRKAFLETSRGKISQEAYWVIRAQILGDNLSKAYYVTNYKGTGGQSVPYVNNLQSYKEPIEIIMDIEEIAKEEFSTYSNSFASALVTRYNYDSCMMVAKPFDFGKCFDYFSSAFSGLLREKILVSLLLQDGRRSSMDLSPYINVALRSFSNGDFLRVVESYRDHVTEGALAFNFQLPDSSGQIRRMEDFTGKVILLDFWYTGCPGCAEAAPYIRQIKKIIGNPDFLTISISIDKNKEKWLKSVFEEKYSDLGSINLFTATEGEDHPMIRHYGINTYPTFILIDRVGKLCRIPKDPRLDGGTDLVSLVNSALDR